MIESHMQPLIIPFDGEAKTSLAACTTPATLVDCYASCNPTPSKSSKAPWRIEAINEKNLINIFYTLIGLDLYDEVVGISWENTEFLKEELFGFLR